MTTLATDAFTDTTGTALPSHTAADGTTYTAHPSSAAAVLISSGGRIYQSVTGVAIVVANVVPGSADYDVAADFVKLSAAGTRFGIAGRCNPTTNDMYAAFYNIGASQWELYKAVSAVLTSLGTFAQALTLSQAYRATLRMVGSTISVLVDGVTRISVTDTAHTAVGRAGIRGANGNGTDTTGLHIDNFAVDGTAVAPTVLTSPSIAPTTGVATGTTLTATPGTYAGVPTPTVTRKWQRDGTDIAGATGTTYTVQAADIGHVLTEVETASNAGGSATGTSNAVSLRLPGASLHVARVTLGRRGITLGIR